MALNWLGRLRNWWRVASGHRHPADVNEGADRARERRLTGLACQGRGDLEGALGQFQQCPVDDGLLEILYNLALAFERQRQFGRAGEIYRRIAGHDPNYRDVARRLGHGGRASAAPGEAPLSPTLGPYRLEAVLGQGAMGIVYLGRDPANDRQLAIKTMALAPESDAGELAEIRRRFFREAEAVQRLDHPNIVAIAGAGEAGDQAYIAMEFLAGGDLLPCCRPPGLLPLPTVLSIAIRIAEALDYAHARHVVHRDIKPANVMYDPATDRVKVTDFGVARMTDASRTRAGTVLGTPSYMSPEQLAGRPVDGRSDLYSLGVMLYQMCCGKLPYTGESLAQLMFRIAHEAAPDIRDINPGLPAAVVAIIGKAMNKNIEARYQRGAEMAADLRAALEEGVR